MWCHFVIDLPAIVSGEWLCFMDPQKKIWRGDPGHKYKLRNNKPEYQDSFKPFVFADPCSLETKQNYPGTLIRFPLRNEPSELSDKLYTVAKLKSLLKALKDDASILLLFLRYIEKIEVFTINTSSFVTKLFSVEADKATEMARKNSKETFFKEVKQFHSGSSGQLPFLQYEVTISVHDIELGSQSIHQWIVANWVGSGNKEILDASQRVCSLPWLGLAASTTSQCPSRLFCFLPMPDSEEVNPPLPICVHGTFGLTKDRRHLKWKTSDMQNDDGALWNDLLLSKMLPSCYAKFLNALRDKCAPDKFYAFWPSVPVINQTNWRVALRPLLSLLLQDQLFWSQNGSWVKLQSSVYVVPQMSSGQFPQVVINALIRCGKVVVVLADRVWEAVKFIYTNGYPFTTITPSLLRQAIKNNSRSYTSMSRTKKFQLLHYCLEDGNYYDLTGLFLLPVINTTFVAFANNLSPNKIYTCSTPFLQTRLLANNEAVLVNVEAEDSSLYNKLVEIANSIRNCTQLIKLTPENFAMMLRQLLPFQNGWCYYGATGGFYNENWLKAFWNWVSVHSLSCFIGIPLVPVCNEKTGNGFKVVALQNKNNSKVIKYNKYTIYHPEVITAAGKLGCHLTCFEEFQFLYHPELIYYVHDLTPSSVLNISLQTSYQNIVFTQEEAMALRYFLFQYCFNLNSGQQSVVSHLHIFPTIQNNTLYSLQTARYTVAGRSAAMLMSEPECLSKYKFCIPQVPAILTCERGYASNLQSMLPSNCWFLTKLQAVLHVILFAIENNHTSKQDMLKFFSILLEPSEYHSLIIGAEGSQVINKLRSLRFIPTSQSGNLHLPSETYDPKDIFVKGLFEDQDVFPVTPFSDAHLATLRELGMKTSVALGPPDVIIITQFICSQTNIQTEVKRANRLLEFLSSNVGNKLLDTYYNRMPFYQTLRTISWLPVMVDPPKGYPKCLGWKGAPGNYFVPVQNLHVSSSPEVHKNLPYLIGSQMKILHYEGSYILSPNLLTSFSISQTVPLDSMIQQLLNLISHSKDIERSKYTTCISLLYDNLQLAAINNLSSQYWQLLSQSEVVPVSENKYVQPSLVTCSFDEKSMTVGILEPYMYILPSHLQQYRRLFCHIGAKEQCTTTDVLHVIENISAKPITDNNHCLQLVNKILNWLCSNFTSTELQQLHERILIPVNSFTDNRLVFKPANKVAFLDEELQWLGEDKESLSDIIEDYYLVHSSVGYYMSCTLQLKPLNTMMANAEEFCFHQHGQSEPLTTRLNRILREYKDTSVIQELLQNADDAGATEVAVYYDTRQHDGGNLLFPGMANSYGPALLFYNNAEFAEEDFENITKIAGETKMNKPLKIGKFGIGFCSVYHITDVPSFVSGENFIVFDPTLQCLKKEIKSEFNPGIKINFHKHRLMKNKSNQLAPYAGVHSFNPKQRFNGTVFRFPLRSKGSEVSENVFSEARLLSMIGLVKENSSKLLMFLNSVRKLSFYQTQGNKFVKDFEVFITKQISNNAAICKVSTVGSTGCREEDWLIATSSQWFQIGYEYRMGTASVSVKLKSDHKYFVDSVKGECFCYLPLNIETGLPVHVSSNFAVMTNRRGIWKADNVATATKESNWNKMLMESVVAQAYITLLLHLQKMQQNGSLGDYSFHSLWPIHLTELNPWESLLSRIYNSILSSEHPLFYSEVTGSWKKLNECNFLSNNILSIGFDDNLHSSLHEVAVALNLPVIELPKQILDRILDNSNFQTRLINEEQFIKYFYCDDTLSKVSIEAKNKIVAASLMVYANNRHCLAIPELMKATKCIPCSPDGKEFKKPIDIIDPTSKIAKLFTLEDAAFPDENFLAQNTLLTQALSKLGLMQSLSWPLLINRAKCVQTWYHQNNKEALNRLVILMECIRDNCSVQSSDKVDKVTEYELQKVAFLPAMPKPQHYPINWKGDTVAKLLPGPELTLVSNKENSVNVVYACGSQVPLLDLQVFPYSLRHLSNKVLKLLGIGSEIKMNNVFKHFNELLEWFKSCSQDEISEEMLKFTNDITMNVYQYLCEKLNSMKDNSTMDDNDLLQHLELLRDKECIWNGKRYLLPNHVSFNWQTNGPYLYRFPEILEKYVSLMKNLGIKEDFPCDVWVNVLCEMKRQFGDNNLPNDCGEVVRLLIPKLKYVSKDTDLEIYLPDSQFILRSIKEIKYNDTKWCPPDQEYLYCHEFVERSVAVHLGVEPVESILLKDLDITEDDEGEEFGQKEELTQRLNYILREYPRDMTFLKELLQNADDAGAKRLYIILDKRRHSDEKVISEEWKELQGPALLFWNDLSFSEEDLKGIQKIGLGSKRDDPDKIGQYGIGFNVVYHFTDCPSFVTNDRLCILDPHHYYIAQNKIMKPGRIYKDLNKMWHRFPDMRSSYLLNDLDEFPLEFRDGSLFRLPLRLTKEAAKASKIVEDTGYFNIKELERNLKVWIPQMREALLFVHNVCDIRFYVIDNQGSVGIFQFDDPHPVSLYVFSHVESVKGKKKVVKESGNANLVMYNVKLANKQANTEDKWHVQLGEGNIENPNLEWNTMKPPDFEGRPRHGIAFPIEVEHFNAKSFCFLPMPDYIKLPVHIHGQFVLNSDRRYLWISSNPYDSNNPDASAQNVDKTELWNISLIEAIAISYVYYLENCIMQGKASPVYDEEMSKQLLKNYYHLFPEINKASSKHWKNLAVCVYKKLSQRNSPILATLTECKSSSDELPSSEKSKVRQYTIKWCKLHLPEELNEGYFYDHSFSQLSILKVLKIIGMNLIDTPLFIYEQFKQVNIILPYLSKQVVLQYYSLFHNDILNHQDLPCDISRTKFGNPKNFIQFIEYLFMDKNPTDGTHSFEIATDIVPAIKKQDLALLLTVNENVHRLSDSIKLFHSSYWKLFVNSPDSFLHNELKNVFKSSHHLVQSSKSNDDYNLIYSILVANLPQSWIQATCAPLGDVKIDWLRQLLKCISEDTNFKRYTLKLLHDFTLIPADNKTMFSTKSDLLPLRIERRDSKFDYLLRKLHVPFLDYSIFGSFLYKINIELPTTATPSDILKCLYLLSEDCHDKLMSLNNDELTTLFKGLSSIEFKNQYDAVRHIRKLPIFTSLHGKLVVLSSFLTVWVCDSVCKAGIEEWITFIPKSIMILHPSAPWSVLRQQADSIYVKDISVYEVYCKYIFPHFYTITSTVRIEHIKFISLNVYPNCCYESEVKSSYEANNFIVQFRSLKCIGDNTDLRDIQSFYDHTQKVFTVFCNKSCFLPKELQHSDLQGCLKYFGLRTVPTTSEFLNYCHKIAELDQTSDIENASKILLKTLFSNDTEYQGLHDQSFLQQVSRIPIAVVSYIPHLDSIKPQKLGECTIKDINKTVNITKLSGSCLPKFKNSVWTCKPLITIPISYHDAMNKHAKMMKTLGITVAPSVDDIIENLKNITDSEFADFSGFHKQLTLETVQSNRELPSIIVNMIQCLYTSVNKESYDHKSLKLQLEKLNFIPVESQMNGHVLVKPIQVLLMDPSTLAPYYPFLHPLTIIRKMQPVILFLLQIGVKMSLDFSHMKLTFTMAKELCQDNKVGVNIKRAVAKATAELTVMLRNSKITEQVKLCPLYLLNKQDVLTECSKLVVFDISGPAPILPPEFTYLNTLRNLTEAKDWNPKELLQLLPKEVGLKSLKNILQYKMINAVQVQTAHSCVTMIEQMLRSDIFKTAVEMYASYCTQNPDPPDQVKEIVKQFQEKLMVEYLDQLQVKPQLHVNNEVIHLQDTLNWDFFLQICDSKFVLSLKNTSSPYPTPVFQRLANELVVILQLKETKCFDFPEESHISELALYIYEILSCGSVAKVGDIIQQTLPGCVGIEQDMLTENSVPVLGEIIPETHHFALDQNIFNYFLPQEWMGYEIEDNKIVYAQVLHHNKLDESTENLQWNLRQKYTITIGNDTIIEATALQLYKFITVFKDEAVEHSQLEVLESYSSVGSMQDTNVQQTVDRKTIRETVKAAWSLTEEEQRKAIKRLFLQYHPDKNPGNPHATANFQLLQQEIERMDRGISAKSDSSAWSGYYSQWSQTASSHRRHQSKHRSRGASAGGMPGGWKVPRPKKDIGEAKRWIKQAKYDYASLTVLSTASKNNESTCASTCFMSHEVAEKSLKAGMYAKCGIGEVTLKNPDLVITARALAQEGCTVDIEDAILLQNCFSNTRYPYCYPSPIVPGEKYLSSTAEEAFLAATRIYEAMKELIEEQDY